MAKLRTVAIVLTLVLVVSNFMWPVDSNLAAMQRSWKEMMKRMRQTRRTKVPGLVSVRRLKKRIASGDFLIHVYELNVQTIS